MMGVCNCALVLAAVLWAAAPVTAATAAAAAPGLRVSLADAAAAPALAHTWSVRATAEPPGLTVRGDGRSVGTVEYAVVYNRTGPTRTWLLTGAVRVANAPGAPPVLLSEVQVEAQLQAPGSLPISRTADCSGDALGAVALLPGGAVSCPFALELPRASATRAVSLIGQATISGGGGQVWSAPANVSLAAAAARASVPMELGRCAVLTDTFLPGGAVPTGFYGAKRSDVGSGASVCAPAEARYVATFGPFSGVAACGTYRATQMARASPLGGNQPTAMGSSFVLLVVDGCSGYSAGFQDLPPLTVPPLPRQPPVAVPAAASPPPPQVVLPPPAAAPPPPARTPVLPAAPAPAPAVPPTPAASRPGSGNAEYEYSYEYDHEAAASGSDITYDDTKAAGRRRRRLLLAREWRAAAEADGLALPDSSAAGWLVDPLGGLEQQDMPAVWATWEEAPEAAAAVEAWHHEAGSSHEVLDSRLGVAAAEEDAGVLWESDVLQHPPSLPAAGAHRALLDAAAGAPVAVSVVGLSVTRPTLYGWQPQVSASAAALTVRRGASAVVSYTVKYGRTQRAAGHMLSGKVRITNLASAALRLGRVTVEVPRPAGAAAAWVHVACPLDTKGALRALPARSSVSCRFTLPYVSAVARGAVVARIVTPAGSEFSSAPATFDTSLATRQTLGACALVSDTFARPDAAGPALLAPAALNTAPTSGSKAPELPATALLCNDAVYAYTARIGPIGPSTPCGSYQIVTTARASPTNGTQPSAAAVSTVAVQVLGCPASEFAPSMAKLLVSGGPLASVVNATTAGAVKTGNTSSPGAASRSGAGPLTGAAGVMMPPELNLESGMEATSTNDGGSVAPAAPVKLPTVAMVVDAVRPSPAVAWGVASTPVPRSLVLAYHQTAQASFSVVYSRTSAAASGRYAVEGRVAVSNPNLVDNLPLARLQVELYRPGASTRGVVAAATCPRGPDGLLRVESQLMGAGRLECTFALDAGPTDVGPGAVVTAVALLADGREAASVPLLLPPASTVVSPAGPRGGPPPGACATLCSSFVLLGDAGGRLLPRVPPTVPGAELLPGQACGGAPSDVVCDSRTVTYTAMLGPLGPDQCGTYKATHMAKADPTTGPQRTAAALADVTITVGGCPGAVVRPEVTDVAPQIVSGAAWAADAWADTDAVTLHWSRSARVEFSAAYEPAQPTAGQLLVGTLRVQNLGTAAAWLAGVQVEVAAADASAPPVSAAAECPLGTDGRVAAGATLLCRFALPYPNAKSGAVVARAILASGGGERSSAPRPFDFEQTLKRVTTGGCAIAADGFASGASQLQPTSTTRPAEAAAPQRICNGQTVSFGARLGPFTQRSCGSYLVTYMARVSPLAGDLPIPSRSAAATVRVTITGCPPKPAS